MTTNRQSLGLGIDAGGTFTDGVIVDLSSGNVLSKGKTPTMKDDLPGSIRQCLGNLDSELLPKCAVASLSTTFATNAIVESRGAKAGLILLGYDAYDMERVQSECMISVPGSHSVRGTVLEPLDAEALNDAIRYMVEVERVEALAVSGMGAVLNPEHEITARDMVREKTRLPVVCGHELSMELDAIRRATTGYINARLLPIVVDLIHALESELRAAGVNAPIMVVRSDGTLMSMSEALTHPIHTIFSGPAASAIGALYLSGCEEGMVCDIGGTTTDILFADKGGVVVSSTGSVVNGLNINTPMVQAHTIGFGGDSIIRRDSWSGISIGPERALPISVLADRFPGVVDELRKRLRSEHKQVSQPIEYFTLGWASGPNDATEREKMLLESLREGAKSSVVLAEELNCPHSSLLPVERLERRGSIMRSGLTPTDIMHSLGRFAAWNKDAADLAVRIYAKNLRLEPDVFIEKVLKAAKELLVKELLLSALSDGGRIEWDEAENLADMVLGHSSQFARIHAEFSCPVVGIGAPVQSYLPEACRMYGFEPIIPEHSEVANAVGAVVGRVAVKTKATISPGKEGFAVHGPFEYKVFSTIESAQEYAEKHVTEYLKTQVHDNYAGLKFKYDVHTQHRTAAATGEEVLIESVTRGTAVCTSMPKRKVSRNR